MTKRDESVRVDRLDFRFDMPKDRRRNQGGRMVVRCTVFDAGNGKRVDARNSLKDVPATSRLE